MNSRDYWAQREAENLKHYISEEEEYNKQLNKIYANMLDECQKEIDSFYGKYASQEGITIAEAKKRVSKLDIAAYERKAAKYVSEKDFSAKANEEMRLYNATMKINRLEMLKANIGLELISGHDEIEKFMSEILQGRTMDELRRQAGILGKTVLDNAKAANAIVNASFRNGTFSDRIWQYQDIMRQDLGKLLQTGLIRGKNPRAIAKDLKKYWYGKDPVTGGGAKYCMERLMRTELARVQTEAQKQSFQSNGFDMYEFIVNGGCCPVCQGLSGKHFRVDKMMPGENAPPMHPNCRCSTAAWEDDAEYEAWLDYLDNGGSTEEWNDRGKTLWQNSQKSAKPVENSKTGAIMNSVEMLKRRSEKREGFKTISDKQFNDLTIEAKKNGATILRGTPDVEKHLEDMGAFASTLGDILMFRADATIGDVLEETHHFMQNLNKINDDKGEPLRTYLNEIDAKRFIIDNAGKYRVPRNEIDLAQDELEYYEKLLDEYKSR